MNPSDRNRNLGQGDRGVVETAMEKSHGLATAVSDAAKTVQEKARDGATAVADTASKTWEGARDIAGNVSHEVADRAETLYTDVVIFARRNPVGCILGSFGLGLVLGMLVRPGR
jgi:hypothetical protein